MSTAKNTNCLEDVSPIKEQKRLSHLRDNLFLINRYRHWSVNNTGPAPD